MAEHTTRPLPPQVAQEITRNRLEKIKRIHKERLEEAEKVRRGQLAKRWKSEYNTWILEAIRSREPNDAIAKKITDDCGVVCKPEDVLRRRHFLIEHRPKRGQKN